MNDIVTILSETQRETGHRRIPAGEGRTVLVRREYDAEIEDVWDAITNPDRINRWFLPITGDLRPGGHYQLTGNASGQILRCEPPVLLAVTWMFAENPIDADVGEVVVRLAPGDRGRTAFELEHTAVVEPARWAEFGPGAVGVGWDLTLLGLSRHLLGGSIEDPNAWFASPEARRFLTGISAAWGRAHEAAGATSDEAAAAARNTKAFYLPEPS